MLSIDRVTRPEDLHDTDLQSQFEPEMQPPEPRRFGVLLFLILAVVIALMTTVLFANGGKNIQTLAKVLHIDIGPRSDTEPTLRPSERSVVQARTGVWPWVAASAQMPLLQREQRPADLCRSFAEDGQEAPAFTAHDDGSWDCSTFRAYAGESGAPSLFLQTRGSKTVPFSAFRIKFNLGADGMTAPLLADALRLVDSSITPLPISNDLEAALKQKLASNTDFYFLFGYYPVTLRQEFSDSKRLNLIVVNRPIPKTAIDRMTKRLPDGASAVYKGPRLATDLTGLR
jgi:hypothetical protein